MMLNGEWYLQGSMLLALRLSLEISRAERASEVLLRRTSSTTASGRRHLPCGVLVSWNYYGTSLADELTWDICEMVQSHSESLVLACECLGMNNDEYAAIRL